MTSYAFALPGFHRVDRGAEIALLAVANALAKRGDDVTVFGSGEARPGCDYKFVHVPAIDRQRFERFPTFPILRSAEAWEDLTFAAGLAPKIRARQFDAAVSCSFPFTHWALRGKSPQRPLRIFVTENGDWPALAQRSEYRSFACDGLVCTNPDYYERNCERWPAVLIPNGVYAAKFSEAKAARSLFGLGDNVPLVLMVSALISSKRVEAGIRAIAALPEVHLVVAGDGPLREPTDRLGAALLGPRYTRLTAAAAEMPKLYASADALLHLSVDESFGNVFVEGLASGLPIVAHDIARVRWIVGDENFLCDTYDQTLLTGAIERALRQGRGARSPGLARFAWPHIAEQYGSFIDGLLAQRQ